MKPTAPFDLPEDITALTSAELQDLEGRAVDAFDALNGKDAADLTDAEVAEMERLAGDVAAIRGQKSANETAAAERAAKVAELAGQVRPPEATTDPEGDAPVEEVPVEELPAEVDAPVVDAPVEDEDEPKLPEAVAASAGTPPKPSIGSLARTRPRGEGDKPKSRARPQGKATILAAAGGSPGFVAGSEMTLDDVAEAGVRAIGGFPQPGRAGRVASTLARIELPKVESLTASRDGQDVSEMLARAADEHSLEGGSLLATGGWCAPSEVLYDFFDEGFSSDGMLSTPEITVTRGGISFTPGPSFADVFAGDGYFQITEAQDIAGGEDATKPCFAVSCPDFDEERLDAAGVCIGAGILQSKGYPELVRKYIDGALVVHGHRLNKAKIDAIVAGSAAVTATSLGAGATAEVLSAVELAIIDYRTKRRMPLEATLEVVLPQWADGLIRADLARQAAVTDYDVTDAQINAWFAVRGAMVQWVYDWQDAFMGAGSASVIGGTTAATGYPTSLIFLVYRAGTWVRGTSSIITLEAVYDSAKFATNDFTALFTEEGFLVAKRGFESRKYTVAICPSGARADAADTSC